MSNDKEPVYSFQTNTIQWLTTNCQSVDDTVKEGTI